MKPPFGVRGVLVAVAVVTVLTAAGVLVVERLRPAPAPTVRANARPSALPAGPVGAAEVVVGPDGAQIFCPSGAAPTITVNDAAFVPALSDGQAFTAGKYRIRLRGLVINETTASIAVDTYVVRVGDAVWTTTVHGPATVPAGGADELTVDGTYDSTGPTRASVQVTMQWAWSATSLRPCGERGLVEDD